MTRAAIEFLKELQEHVAHDRHAEALALSDEAVGLFPTDERVLHAHAIVLRRAGRMDLADAFVSAEIEKRPNVAWLHAQIGVIAHGLPRAIQAFRRAHELEPMNLDYRMGLIQALGRFGDQGADLEEAYQLLRPVLYAAPHWPERHLHVAFHVLKSVCAYDELDALGDPLSFLGRQWAEAGNHTGLFFLLSYANSDASRAALVELHKLSMAPVVALAEQKRRPGDAVIH